MKRKCNPKVNKAIAKKNVTKSDNSKVKIPKVPIQKKKVDKVAATKKLQQKLESDLEKYKSTIQILDTNIQENNIILTNIKERVREEQDKYKDNTTNYKRKYEELERIESNRQAKLNMIQEDYMSLNADILNSEQRISYSKDFVERVHSTERTFNADITKLKDELKNRQKEIMECENLKIQLIQQLGELESEEIKLKEEDLQVEHAIQTMKDTLYTIVCINQPNISQSYLDIKVPNKPDSWLRLKVDSMIPLSSPNNSLFDCTKIMIKKSLEYKGSDVGGIVVSKFIDKDPELTFIVLSCNNNFVFIREYIEKVLKSLEDMVECSVSVKVTGSVYSLNGDKNIIPLKLGELSLNGSDVNKFIEVMLKEQEKTSENYILEICVYTSDIKRLIKTATVLKFIFINSKSTKNLEEIDRIVISQNKSNEKISLLQESFTSIRIGYLILQLDGKDVYTITRTAKNLLENISIIK